MIGSEQVLKFWFNELGHEGWFKKDPETDKTIKERFESLWEHAAMAELYPWRTSPEGRLAEIIVLDQFPRNMFRDDPRAFSTDALALILSQEAIHQNAHTALSASQKAFMFMPFMHSESLIIQRQSVELFSAKGLEENYDFAIRHLEIIERFGRFPHRNSLLNRNSTSLEKDFLTQPNSSF